MDSVTYLEDKRFHIFFNHSEFFSNQLKLCHNMFIRNINATLIFITKKLSITNPTTKKKHLVSAEVMQLGFYLIFFVLNVLLLCKSCMRKCELLSFQSLLLQLSWSRQQYFIMKSINLKETWKHRIKSHIPVMFIKANDLKSHLTNLIYAWKNQTEFTCFRNVNLF